MANSYDQLICPQCNGPNFVKAGKRQLKNGDSNQLYRCSDCDKRFSSRNRSGKQTDPRAILKTLILVCRGYTYPEIQDTLKREYGVVRDKATLSRWVGDFPLPWLQISRQFTLASPLVRSHCFTHAGLHYSFQVHQAKLRFAKRYPSLINYLQQLPNFLDPTLFDRAQHCSQMQCFPNPGLRHSQGIALCELAGKALSLAPTRPKRHSTLQSYFLYGDRSTLATEVPVYLRDPQHGLIAGHIDFVQIHANKLRLLDYKPNAAQESPEKVVTQLSLYANALSRRARVPLNEIECVYFDEKDAYFFNPHPMADAEEDSDETMAAFRQAHAGEAHRSDPDRFRLYPADRRKGVRRSQRTVNDG